MKNTNYLAGPIVFPYTAIYWTNYEHLTHVSHWAVLKSMASQRCMWDNLRYLKRDMKTHCVRLTIKPKTSFYRKVLIPGVYLHFNHQPFDINSFQILLSSLPV